MWSTPACWQRNVEGYETSFFWQHSRVDDRSRNPVRYLRQVLPNHFFESVLHEIADKKAQRLANESAGQVTRCAFDSAVTTFSAHAGIVLLNHSNHKRCNNESVGIESFFRTSS